MLFKKRLTKENLVGVWKHQLLASWGNISITNKDGHTEEKPFNNYNYEVINFKHDGSFTFGEYGQSGPLYEVKGWWTLSVDKTRIEFSYQNGEKGSIDIRDFDGNSFITTSIQGNDFKYIRQ